MVIPICLILNPPISRAQAPIEAIKGSSFLPNAPIVQFLSPVGNYLLMTLLPSMHLVMNILSFRDIILSICDELSKLLWRFAPILSSLVCRLER